ncbi:MAG: NB-ARC domain-containing protein, partial [Pseudanabaenales cyanobacterium]|nr:NB-ARC domain-containing protein [Pseudanabaenales cyanobacterium]
MTLSKILERAKRGDPAAIAALFNRSLQSRGITVTASRKDNCIYIHLVSAQFPETKRLIGFILQGIRRLDAKPIHTIQIDGQLIGRSDFLFQEKLVIADTASEKLQKSSSQSKTPQSLQFSNQGSPVRPSDSFSIAASEPPTEHLGKASASERANADIVANVKGRISGQIATGNYILQIGSMHGGVVRVVSEEKQPTPQPRSLPVFLRPRPFRNLVGRKREVAIAIKTLQSVQPLEFYGQSGLGKTSLLRHLAYHPQAISDFSDGVVYLAAERQTVPDLLQALFDAFYETDRPLKPTETQLRHALQQLRALILLDDVTLSRNKLQLLMNEAPGCIFAMTASNRHLWGEGQSLLLPNLSVEDALLLVEQELGRKIHPKEHSVATELCTFLKGHPLKILRALALGKERRLSLAGVLRKLQAASSPEALTTQIVSSLSESERQVLKVLQVLGNVPIRAEALAGLMNLPTLEPTLSTFLKKGLIQTDGSYYRLSNRLVRPLQDNEDLNSDLDGLLEFMRNWVKQPYQTPQNRLQDTRL